MSVLYCAAIYVSTAARELMKAIEARASRVPRLAIVDNFSDPSYARSSLKLVGDHKALLEAACAAAFEALARVNLDEAPHPAPHPRVGAVDMVAFMPLSESSGSTLSEELATCEDLATALGRSLGDAGNPVLLYGPRVGRSLLETRQRTSFFQSVRADSSPKISTRLPLDFGPSDIPSSGLSVIGAMTYVTNYNIQVEGASLAECRDAAASLRREMQVQVMALPHEGDSIEIGCNLQATHLRDSPSPDEVLSVVRQHLPESASVSRAYVVGLTPAEALRRAREQLDV